MPLNGIDISSHNKGLDLRKIDCDFVIVKATQGRTYTNPYFAEWCGHAKLAGKLLGVYHYVAGGNARGEAEFFAKTIAPVADRAMICIDWEEYQNKAWRDEWYLDDFIAALRELIPNRKFMIYASLSTFPKSVADKYGCGRWIAQYANNRRVDGFQVTPWKEGAYNCAIRQYTSEGYLAGWANRLDLNKAYMTRQGWVDEYTVSDGSVPAPKPVEAEVFPKSFKGRWKVIANSGIKIRRSPGLKGAQAGALKKGSTVWLDATRTKADGYWWGTYIGYSGKRCYVAVGTVDGTAYMERV